MRSHDDLDHEIEATERRIRERRQELREEVATLKIAAREAGDELRAHAMKPVLVAVALAAGYLVARRRRRRPVAVERVVRKPPRSALAGVAAAALSTLMPRLLDTAQAAAVQWFARRARRPAL